MNEKLITALRQFKHNDGSEGFVNAYDMAIADREFAVLTARADRFYMDHGVLHDRETGLHLWSQDDYDREGRAAFWSGQEEILIKFTDPDEVGEVADLYARLLTDKRNHDTARGLDRGSEYYIRDAIRRAVTQLAEAADQRVLPKGGEQSPIVAPSPVSGASTEDKQ